jgi:hypothetical protein
VQAAAERLAYVGDRGLAAPRVEGCDLDDHVRGDTSDELAGVAGPSASIQVFEGPALCDEPQRAAQVDPARIDGEAVASGCDSGHACPHAALAKDATVRTTKLLGKPATDIPKPDECDTQVTSHEVNRF